MIIETASSDATHNHVQFSDHARKARALMQRRLNALMDQNADGSEWNGAGAASAEVAELVTMMIALEEAADLYDGRRFIEFTMPSGKTFTTLTTDAVAEQLRRVLTPNTVTVAEFMLHVKARRLRIDAAALEKAVAAGLEDKSRLRRVVLWKIRAAEIDGNWSGLADAAFGDHS